ncbi:MAG: DUF4443 domain-containing protein [Candidatus Nezhaarchaeota archaeon]|nr:DUF4443 domain-containing protein [Candidatus Nezhaarchaeota archaeon]MCX8142421.1 DUF4443 domain-containing protein [Candidatus Nezhaarchaeota archaeon]MDW8050606.1 DUF4443 domain-containing protein [Nitrososphaerota archaeon]
MDPREVVRIIDSALSSQDVGPAPRFDEYHIIKSIMIILKEKTIGRVRLSRILSIGEGSARTMVSRMKALGIIEESKAGCTLTALGHNLAEALSLRIPMVADVQVGELGVDGFSVGILVRGVSDRVDVIKLRDEAVRRGARALITMILIDGRLAMPTVEDNVMARWPKLASNIIEVFRPIRGDVILIGVADNRLMAEKGALMAAWTLAFKWTI